MRSFVLTIALASLAGCSFAPPNARPELPVPPSWPVGDAYLRQSEAALPSVSYAQVFTDARLQAIIGQALLNNRDLRVAAANIAAARAQYQIQRGGLFPEVDVSGRFTRTEGGSGSRTVTGTTTTGSDLTGGTTGTSSGNTTGSTTGTTTGNNTGGSITSVGGGSSNFSLSLGSTSFELDLFGRVRSLTRSAQDRYFAQEAAARQTRLVLVSSIATAWLTYAADQSLLRIARETAASAQRTVQLTQARLSGGIAPRTDLTQAITVLATAQADLGEQTTLLAQDVNQLQLLVGAPVSPTLLPADLDQVVPTIRPIPAGIDSRVLLRRPDVVQAEYQLYAANADIGAARAALFPRVSLTALAGLAATSLGGLFTGGALSGSVAPSISYPIFRGGAARANVRYSQAQRDASVANYERAIQTAFREASDALARNGTAGAQLAAQRRNRDAAAETLNLANARYRGGIDPFLNTLDAQRTLYNTQRNFVTTQLTEVSNLVTLYQVLGGDSTLDATASGPSLLPAASTPPR